MAEINTKFNKYNIIRSFKEGRVNLELDCDNDKNEFHAQNLAICYYRR